ncbi:TetR/AcrR family transcriptional regulator [Candidatus Frankia alpina]|uniref:TetR/AcrR family transcriptional regulator n=1 Tax=Candidatus Frankia alpina TaxID=2699483 RepID=UPI001F3B2E3B|nr:TetR/AcrR family transcriptional regulator [Candidatus Frankia alpina]
MPSRPLRRDAELNRVRILTAAYELFVERGDDVGAEEIARRAGVGMGTLYRRFSNKNALIEAILQTTVDDLRELAVEVAAAEPSATALHCYLLRVLGADPCRGAYLARRLWSGRTAERMVAEVVPPVTAMLAAAQRAGTVRTDVVPADLLVLMRSLRLVMDLTERVAPGSWRRSLDIILAGFRPDSRNADLPGPLPAFVVTAGSEESSPSVG